MQELTLWGGYFLAFAAAIIAVAVVIAYEGKT